MEKKKVFITRDLFPTGEEFIKMPIDQQKALTRLLLTPSDQSEDVLRLAASMQGGIYEGPFRFS